MIRLPEAIKGFSWEVGMQGDIGFFMSVISQP